MEDEKTKVCTKEKNDLKFSVAFKKDGESFQSIMEKILINKIYKND